MSARLHTGLLTLVAATLLAATLLVAPAALAGPRPATTTRTYSLDIHGFNDGEPYRLKGSEANAVLAEAGAVVFQFKSSDWSGKKQAGTFVSVSQLTRRFAKRPATDLVEVYRLDLDGDDQPEFLLNPLNQVIKDGRRYAPTLLKRVDGGLNAFWAAKELPGARFKVQDLRDMNGDGSPEFILGGEAGRRGYYQFHRLVGFGSDGRQTLAVRHVDSVHLVDLNRDGWVEVVVRTRVGRKGPASQWTYVDQLYVWDGETFADATEDYPRYHDEQTLPTLVDDLIDHYDVAIAIRVEKIQAIETIRAAVMATAKKPRGYRRKMVKLLKHVRKKRYSRALEPLKALHAAFAYEPRVLIALATIYGSKGQWGLALDSAIRSLTIRPRHREAWWHAAIAFTHLSERSSALASLHNLVELGHSAREGLSFLRARRGEQGLHPDLSASIDDTLGKLQE